GGSWQNYATPGWQMQGPAGCTAGIANEFDCGGWQSDNSMMVWRVGAGAGPSQLTLTSASGLASSTATIGACTVGLRDAQGNIVASSSATTVNLSSNSAGTKVFSATSGGATVSSVTIPAGALSTTFYYGDTKTGSATITASASSLTSATGT